MTHEPDTDALRTQEAFMDGQPEDAAEWRPAQRAAAAGGLAAFGLVWLAALPFCAVWFVAAWLLRQALKGFAPRAA